MITFDFGKFISILCLSEKRNCYVISTCLNNVFESLIQESHVFSKSGKEFYFTDSSVSRLKHHKDDVPQELRKGIIYAYEKGKLSAKKVYFSFCDSFCDHDQIISNLKLEYDNAGLVRNINDSDQNFFLKCIVEAIKPNNKFVPDKTRKMKSFWEWTEKEKNTRIANFIESHCYAHNISFDDFDLEILKNIICNSEYPFSDEEIHLMMKRFVNKTSIADHPQMTKEQILEEKLCFNEVTLNAFQMKRAIPFLSELKKLEIQNKQQLIKMAYKKKDYAALYQEIREIYVKKNYFYNLNLRDYLIANSFLVPKKISTQIPNYFASFLYEVGYLMGLWKIDFEYISRLFISWDKNSVEQYGYDSIIKRFRIEYRNGYQTVLS